MERYVALANSDVRPYLGTRNRFPTNEEFLRAVPSQQDLRNLTTDIRRTFSSESMRSGSSPGSGKGVSRFLGALNVMDQIPALKRLSFSLACDRNVWEAILNNDVMKEIRRAFNQAATKLLGDSETPGTLPSIWTKILNIIMPKLSALSQFLASLFNCKSKAKDDDNNGVNVSQDFIEAQDIVITGTLIGLSLIVILMVAVMI